jgi:cell division protein FtsB
MKTKKTPTQLCGVEFQIERVKGEIKNLEAEVEALRKELEDGGE